MPRPSQHPREKVRRPPMSKRAQWRHLAVAGLVVRASSEEQPAAQVHLALLLAQKRQQVTGCGQGHRVDTNIVASLSPIGLSELQRIAASRSGKFRIRPSLAPSSVLLAELHVFTIQWKIHAALRCKTVTYVDDVGVVTQDVAVLKALPLS